MKNIILFFILLFSTSMYGQSDLTEKEVQNLELLKTELSGTYQVQMINTRSLPSIPLLTFKKIKEVRKQSETVFIHISDNCRIMVISKDELNAPDFEPLSYLTFINEQNK